MTRTPRAGTKQAALIAMLRAPEDATTEEIMVATNWASHYADNRIMPIRAYKPWFSAGIAASKSA